MSLFYLEYNFVFQQPEKPQNPRICKLAIRQSPDAIEFLEAGPDDEKIDPARFSERHYRFRAYVGGSLVFDSKNITPANQLDKTLLSGDVEIGFTPLADERSTITLTVPLSAGNEDKTIRINVKGINPRVPMMNYSEIPKAPKLKPNLMFHPRITPASAFRLIQTIDQSDLQRGVGVGFYSGLIPNFSAGVGKGYGTWNIYNKDRSSKLTNFAYRNFELYTKFTFEAKSVSLSLDVGAGAAAFTMVGILGGFAGAGGPQYSVAGSQNVFVENTIEAQRIRYDYTNTNLKGIIKKILENFKDYSTVYYDPPVNQTTNTQQNEIIPGSNDFDKDGTATIVDRISDLSTTGISNINSAPALNVFSKDATNELRTLVSRHSIIGKSVVIKGLTKLSKVNSISYNGKQTGNFESGMKVYKIDDSTIGNNMYVVFEEGLPEGFTINNSSKYTLYSKCLVPDWNSHFDYLFYKNSVDILGVGDVVGDILNPLFQSKSAINLSQLKDPLVLFVVRGRTIISNSQDPLVNTPQKINVRNRSHNDTIMEEKEDYREGANFFSRSPSYGTSDSIRAGDSFLANVPLESDYSIDNVGYAVGPSGYFEIIPGYGLQVRAGHGLYFQLDRDVRADLAQSKIQGELSSPHVVLNPFNFSDVLGGSNSSFQDGSTLEVFSNMGREKNASGDLFSTLPYFSPNAGGGNLGGNLDYLFQTVTETADVFTPSLVAFKSNLNSKEEYVTYKDGKTNALVNYKILSSNKRFANAVSDFSENNVKFENIKNSGSIYSDCSDDVIQLDDNNETDVNITKDNNDIIIENVSGLGFSEISQIHFKIKNPGSVDPGKTFPYVLFYQTSTVETSNSADTMATFGSVDNKGKVIPKIFNLSNGENYIHCRNLLDATKIVLKPAKGIDDINIDFSQLGDLDTVITTDPTQTDQENKSKIYAPKELLNKNPIGHIRLSKGDQFLIIEAREPNTSSPAAIVAAELHTQRSKLNYPNLFTDDEIDIESNYRLEDFVQSEFIASGGKAKKNQYYLLGYMDDANILEDPKGFFYLIGFLYDDGGQPSNTLASIPIPKKVFSDGVSIFDIYKDFDQFLTSEGKTNKQQPDLNRFPFFSTDGKKQFIIHSSLTPKQKVGVCKIGKSTIKLIFVADEKGGIICYVNNNIGHTWKRMPDNFSKNIFNYQEIKNSEETPGELERQVFNNQRIIEFRRFACSRETFEDSIYLFSLCEIFKNRYYVLMKRVPYDVIEYYMEKAVDEKAGETAPESKNISDREQEILDLLMKEEPVMAIGNPNLIFPSKELKIHVGNAKKNDGTITNNEDEFIPISPLKNDNTTDSDIEVSPEENLNNFQNIDISQDLRSGTIKIYFINNKGIRDCKASLSTGKTWQSYMSF